MPTAVQLPGKNKKVIEQVFSAIDVHEEQAISGPHVDNASQVPSSASISELTDELSEVDSKLKGVKPAFQSAYGAADCHEEEAE